MTTSNNKALKAPSLWARKDPHVFRLLLVMAIWLIFMALTKPTRFYTLINFQTMASQFPEFGLMSLGVMLCMITGGIDLSPVAVANLVSVLMAFLLKELAPAEGGLPGYAIPLVLLLGTAMGAVLGIMNGILVSKVRIPPILATLGMSELLTGVAIVITGGAAVSKLPVEYATTINSKIAGLVPVQLVIFGIMAVLVWFLLNRTTFGTKLYLLGTNPQAARYSGLNNDRLLILTYMISGIAAALGGLVMLANYNSARANYGSVYVLQCILVVVLGGVSPTGGRGKISGVVLAIFLLRMLETGINRFPQISSYYISLIWGGVLLLVMVLDYFSAYRGPKKRKAA
ncbi:MAG: ABC transporter permease [Christensenellales bacterium]|jgi:simple sugar transport system permease protein